MKISWRFLVVTLLSLMVVTVAKAEVDDDDDDDGVVEDEPDAASQLPVEKVSMTQ